MAGRPPHRPLRDLIHAGGGQFCRFPHGGVEFVAIRLPHHTVVRHGNGEPIVDEAVQRDLKARLDRGDSIICPT